METARALGNLSRHADARRCMASLRLDEILVPWSIKAPRAPLVHLSFFLSNRGVNKARAKVG